jgi:hypothetical protein
MQHISKADVENISEYSLLVAKKSLMKTELLLTQKSSKRHISILDVEIISEIHTAANSEIGSDD